MWLKRTIARDRWNALVSGKRAVNAPGKPLRRKQWRSTNDQVGLIRKSTIADAARIVNPIKLVRYQKLEKSTGFQLIPDESFDV